MSDQIQTAMQVLLEPTGLGDHDLTRTINQVMGPKIDYADLYFQHSRHESWSLDEGTVKSGSYSIDQGSGSGRSVARKPDLPTPMKSSRWR